MGGPKILQIGHHRFVSHGFLLPPSEAPGTTFWKLAFPEDYNTIHGTNPEGAIRSVTQQTKSVRTSQIKHCIIVSCSVFASYGRPHRQNWALKFGPYVFRALSSSRVLCRVQAWEMEVVGQSQRKFRFGNLSKQLVGQSSGLDILKLTTQSAHGLCDKQ